MSKTKEEWKVYNASDKRKEYRRKWREKNRDKINKYQREYFKTYRKRTIDNEILSTAGLGRKYEKIALSVLQGAVDCNADCFHGGYDLVWNNCKIEVKMRNVNKNNRWGFTSKKTCNADYFLLFCVNNDITEKLLLLPREIFGDNLNIGRLCTKYDKFLISQ